MLLLRELDVNSDAIVLSFNAITFISICLLKSRICKTPNWLGHKQSLICLKGKSGSEKSLTGSISL